MSNTHCTLLLLVTLLSIPAYSQDWEFTGGPGGDLLTSITFAPNGDLYVLSSALHRSTDKGITWERLAQEVVLTTSSNSSKLAFQNDHTLFLGTPRGVWKSVDRGHSWTNVLPFVTRLRVDIAVSESGTVIYTLTDSLMISNDAGFSWRSEKRKANKVFIDSSGNFYISGDLSYRSTNRGASWAKLVNGFSSGSLYDLKPLSKSHVIGASRFEVFLSSDTGRTWTKCKALNSANEVSLAVSGKDSIFLLNSNGLIEISTDMGNTWVPFGTVKNMPSYNLNLAFRDGQLYTTVTTELRTSSSSNAQWETLFIPNSVVTCLSAHPSGDIFASTLPIWGDNYYYGKLWSLSNAALWRESPAFQDEPSYNIKVVSSIVIDSTGLLLVSKSGAFVMSSDGGQTWTESQSTFLGWANDLAVNKEGFVFLANAGEGVFRTTDRGVTWDQLNEGITDLQIFSVSTSTNGVVFASGRKTFFRSTNYGFTWEEINFPFILGTENVRTIANIANNVVVGADKSGVYFSSDNGFTWENHSEGLALDTINDILITPAGPIFTATTTGIYEYNSSTQMWKLVSSDGLAGNILSLALGANGKIYAGTAGGGVYRSTKTYGSWLSVPRDEYAPGDISIYPNPASSEIRINFESGKPEKFRTVIYNLLGEVIQVNNNEETVDVSSLHNRQYFLRIFTDDRIQTLPLSIVR